MDHWLQAEKMSELLVKYETERLKKMALRLIPKSEIERKTECRLRRLQLKARKAKTELNESQEYENIFLEELVLWFKVDFFVWFDAFTCETCNVKTTFNHRELSYSKSENGQLAVEVFKCPSCSRTYTFPRHNNPEVLLDTRKGRCAEFANVFTLMCRSLGFDARMVYDVTDHVWTEIYSGIQNRWIHMDPCEGVVDKPLMYELGWKKKLSYIFAVGIDEINDVTWRYSCNHKAILSRRDPFFQNRLISNMINRRKKLVAGVSKGRAKYLLLRTLRELAELMNEPSSNESFSGRTSGSVDWKKQRGELGVLKPGHKWSLPKESNQLSIQYNCSTDEYRSDGRTLNGWDDGVYLAEDIFRKVEYDWKMSYLVRDDGSEEGVVIWFLDCSSCSKSVSSVKIDSPILSKNGAQVVWTVSFISSQEDLPPGAGNQIGNVPSKLKKHLESIAPNATTLVFKNVESVMASNQSLKPVHQVLVSASLSKGDSWQSAQIFRQPLSDKSRNTSYGFTVFLN